MKIVKKHNKVVVLLLTVLLIVSCTPKKDTGTGKTIAVFIPGTLAGSAIYQMLADGVKKAADEVPGTNVDVIEAGGNQAEWESKLTALAAMGKYSLIVSSNPSMPVIAESVQRKFPKQYFMILDGELSGNKNIYTLSYNNGEQAYMAGCIAGLLCNEFGTDRVGLIAAQEYPVMMEIILPYYTKGVQFTAPGTSVDFRVIGSWTDSAKAADISDAMIADGSRVILTIAGGANDGAVRAAENSGSKVIWFDTNGYAIKPGVIAGSAVIYQDRAAYNKTKLFLEGTLPFGSAEHVGVAQGYVDFVEDDPIYIKTVSAAVREAQSEIVKQIKAGEVIITK
ncbi:MAG: BMP family ABC transporter substrate-binding protein [Spirochaetaceae bacterium]|jgi:simple sugar transport system substrate-binding protein|nr:BMP family ABC transporter substrate-binding protein [Spirochaetaceae bacterium]